MKQLRGLGTALVTPFTATGEVDYPALGKLLDHQLAGAVDYIVVLGTTGEAATMTREEKEQVSRYIVNHIGGRIPLVLGLGGNCTAHVLEDLQQWHDTLVEHYTAILSVCPYYNKPSQEGLYQHFTTIAQASPVPVILYNVPGRTGVNMLPETVMRIREACPSKVVGIKEASGNLPQIERLIGMSKETDLLVISGDDGLAAEVMRLGGAGLISVAANAWPEAFGKIVREADAVMQQRFDKMVELLFKEGNPSGIKTTLAQMGLIGNHLRLPLVPNSKAVETAIAKEIASLE